jgi:CRP-like cAMP-binding protein
MIQPGEVSSMKRSSMPTLAMIRRPKTSFLTVTVAMLPVSPLLLDPICAFSNNLYRPGRQHFDLGAPISRDLYSKRSTAPLAVRNDNNDEDTFPDPHALMEYLDGDSAMDGSDFISFEEFQELQRKQQYLKACPIFRDCTENDLSNIAKSMVLQEVAPGKKLVAQGESGRAASAMYFLKSGSFQAIGEPSSKDEEPVTYRTYSKEGSFFGELALLFGQPRAASIISSELSAVYRLEKAAFLESIVDSPVYDTAKRLILSKYESKRLLDVLPKIRLDELVGLVKARLFSPKNNRLRTWLATLRIYSLGACASLFVTKYIKFAAVKPMAFLLIGAFVHLL